MKNIENFCKEYWIKINEQKTVLVLFGNKNWTSDDLKIEVAGINVHPSSQEIFLGVILDSKLTFKQLPTHFGETFPSMQNYGSNIRTIMGG